MGPVRPAGSLTPHDCGGRPAPQRGLHTIDASATLYVSQQSKLQWKFLCPPWRGRPALVSRGRPGLVGLSQYSSLDGHRRQAANRRDLHGRGTRNHQNSGSLGSCILAFAVGALPPAPRHLPPWTNSMMQWSVTRTTCHESRVTRAKHAYDAAGVKRKMPGRVPKRDPSRLGSRSVDSVPGRRALSRRRRMQEPNEPSLSALWRGVRKIGATVRTLHWQEAVAWLVSAIGCVGRFVSLTFHACRNRYEPRNRNPSASGRSGVTNSSGTGPVSSDRQRKDRLIRNPPPWCGVPLCGGAAGVYRIGATSSRGAGVPNAMSRVGGPLRTPWRGAFRSHTVLEAQSGKLPRQVRFRPAFSLVE